MGRRLVDHDSRKDLWDEVAIITSKDANLTSALVRYLESRLVRIARNVGRVALENVQGPTGGAELPEADASDMDCFIEQGGSNGWPRAVRAMAPGRSRKRRPESS